MGHAYLGGGVAYCSGCYAVTDPGFNGNVQGHGWAAAMRIGPMRPTPQSTWTVERTNVFFDLNGRAGFTNSAPSEPQRFYRVKSP